jgi:hypothetical protein
LSAPHNLNQRVQRLIHGLRTKEIIENFAFWINSQFGAFLKN